MDNIKVTDENGYVDFGTFIDLVPGTYYYREIIAPKGYTLNKNIYSLTIDEEGNVIFNEENNGVIYNERIRLIIRKYIDGTEIGLSGAHIALYDSNGNIVINNKGQQAVIETNENGEANFETFIELEPGTYYYKEIKAPNGYKLNVTIYSLTIDEEGNITFNEDLSIEEIVKSDPDYIFVTTMGDEENAKAYLENNALNHPAWSGLTAVKDNNYYILPKDLFHYKPNNRWSESYEYLAKIIWPEIFEG